MKDTIYNELEDAIFGILINHQDELGITSGDDYVDFTLTIKLLAEQIHHTLLYQADTNGLTDRLTITDGVWQRDVTDGISYESWKRDLRIEDAIRKLVED